MSSSDLAKKRRKCGSKTKTGCGTCKIRRVKCDEAKPVCQRCAKTGRVCDGYSLHLVLSGPKGNEAIHRVFTPPVGSKEERRGFQYFITQTAADLSGFYNSSFWQSHILQASVSEPSLRHAVVAISSLHEEFVNNRLSYDANTESKGQAFAMKQYSKAIVNLRQSLAAGKYAPVAALLSCILFVCFDSLRGYFDSAIVHLQSGLKILQDLRANPSNDTHFIETEIAPLFTRLSLQAVLYFDTRSTPERRAFVDGLAFAELHDDVPGTFETVLEAQNCMNKAVDGLFRAFYLCDESLPVCCQPLEVQTLLAKYIQRQHDWDTSYSNFMACNSEKIKSKELRGAALLKIHCTITKIMADAVPSFHDPRSFGEAMNDHATFAQYDKEFRTVVALSDSLITAAEADAKNGKPALTFSTDLGLVGPLYYVCIRCEDASIRWEALSLLERSPRREGMWDSRSGVKLVKEYWDIRESYLKPEQPGELERKRQMCDVVDLVLSDGMKWEWHLKDPFENKRGNGGCQGSMPAGHSRAFLRGPMSRSGFEEGCNKKGDLP